MAKVLVVEDDRHIRLFITANLKARGFNVLETSSPGEAHRIMLENKPDIILLDILFTEGTGWDFARKLAHDALYHDVPIIVMTASEFDFGKHTYPYQNVVRRLMKPISAADLIGVIHHVLSDPIG